MNHERNNKEEPTTESVNAVFFAVAASAAAWVLFAIACLVSGNFIILLPWLIGWACLTVGVWVGYLVRRWIIWDQQRASHVKNLKTELSALQDLVPLLLEDKTFLQFQLADQNRERQVIAQDLHDTVMQKLASAKWGLEVTAQRLAYEDNLGQTVEGLQACFDQLTRIMNSLSPPTLFEEGLVSTFRKLALMLPDSMEFDLVQDEDFPRLQPFLEYSVYQIVRESLDNVRRHSLASHCSIELRQDNQTLYLTIADNGNGFDPSSVQWSGLARIRETIERFEGHLSIETDSGTQLSFEIQVQPVNSQKIRDSQLVD